MADVKKNETVVKPGDAKIAAIREAAVKASGPSGSVPKFSLPYGIDAADFHDVGCSACFVRAVYLLERFVQMMEVKRQPLGVEPGECQQHQFVSGCVKLIPGQF
jgi:hypothetical protein